MKINNNHNIQKILNNYKKSVNHVNKTEKVKLATDQMQISEGAREYQVALKAYREVADIRQSKVDNIKNQISSGKYNPSLEEVADRILNKNI
ncbi:flagellar biosynthesis anti-sigma factor FlgM [Anaerophilus nitritogenes]|uniref:flagellar biosynthesis anti-sigma factor FlgM n=1 Tax=Anaerophilus nitritogenes TaxID=2498136 RepID=UPI00101D5753|nr:flagellar biosynthesis anti-sigma factor FlgM [Anaerophilus nitritogenes]